MKTLKTGGLVLIMMALAVSLAWSQDEPMFLNSQALGSHERPLVKFSHEGHGNIECRQCHHDLDEYFNNQGGDGNKCSDCHLASPGPDDNPMPLLLAMHTNCKQCHGAMRARGRKSGPVMCGQCHLPGAKAPAVKKK